MLSKQIWALTLISSIIQELQSLVVIPSYEDSDEELIFIQTLGKKYHKQTIDTTHQMKRSSIKKEETH